MQNPHCAWGHFFAPIGLVRENQFETDKTLAQPCRRTKSIPFRYFKTSPKIIRLAAMRAVRFPLSLWNVEDLLHERDVDVSHETVWFRGKRVNFEPRQDARIMSASDPP